MRIRNSPKLKRFGQVVCAAAMKPGSRGLILNPRVIRPDVIFHLILNHLYRVAVRFVDELTKSIHASEMFFDAIQIGGAVAMIVSNRLAVVSFGGVQMVAVVVNGSRPDGGDAQFFEIRKMVDDTLQIASVIEPGLAAVQQT